MRHVPRTDRLPAFDRHFLGSSEPFTCIGGGSLGGKAEGLWTARDILELRLNREGFAEFEIGVPTLVVIGTDVFDAFVSRNKLREFCSAEDSDIRVAQAFQRAEFPAEHVGDLWSLTREVRQPLAIRSSSLLEDALAHPFAGVYGTKMIPNNQVDPESRFRNLVEAVKFVYASAFLAEARSYIEAVGRDPGEEKMAVVIQEIVGRRHNSRFYPDVSGVARSYSFYPSGSAQPGDGVVSLALGLGKTIVDGSVCWTYSPAHPRASPPYSSIRELMDRCQVEFWSVNMGNAPAYDPIRETEYLLRHPLADAEIDGTLGWTASTYNASSDRISPGIGIKGPRVVNFAPLLAFQDFPLNRLVRDILKICEEELRMEVEIEFAVTLPGQGEQLARFGLLQVRPMAVPGSRVDVGEQELQGADVLVGSGGVLGNGIIETIRDVVYVRPGEFELRNSQAVALEIAACNRRLVAEGCPYLLIGFGRWGSSDPWLGIPVNWSQIAGAKVIVESALAGVHVESSQGAHFFHNLISFEVPYFCVGTQDSRAIDWGWLENQESAGEYQHVRHVRLVAPLLVRVDGRNRRGVILKP